MPFYQEDVTDDTHDHVDKTTVRESARQFELFKDQFVRDAVDRDIPQQRNRPTLTLAGNLQQVGNRPSCS